MADITNDALEAWFNEKYMGNTASSEDRAAYEAAQDKNEFRARMIAEERSKRERENQNQNQNDSQRIETNFTSDEWQQLISGENTDFLNSGAPIRVGIDRAILAQMNKLPENFASLDDDAQQDAINLAKANLNADERNDFNQRDKALKQEILEYYPPRRLVDTSRWLEEAENHASTDAIKAEMQASRAALMEVMVSKVNKYANDETIVDQTNIADVYDGARLMYDYVEEKNPDNDALKQNIEICRGKLEEQINIYDEANGFTGLTHDDAYEINETYLRAQKRVNEELAKENEAERKIKNPPEDLAQVWDNIEFVDNTQRDNFINSFNEAVIKKATMNAAVKNKGKKGEELDAAIQEEINIAYAAELTAMLTANEAAKHLAQEEQKRQANPSYVPQPMSEQQAKAAGQAAYDAVINGTGGNYKVDNKVQVANFARYTNDAFGYLNRLGTKIGKKTNAVGNMAKSVKDFDNTCIKRFDPYYTIARTQAKAVWGNMGRQALNQVVRYGSSLVPGGNFLYGAYVGGQAIWRLGTKYKRLKEEAKKNNRKLTLKGFLKDHVGEITTSALATGAALLGGAAAKDAAKGLGIAAMAVGNLTNVVKTFKRQREKGESWWKSASVAAFSATLSTGTALGTSYALGLGMQATGLGTTSHDSVVTDRSEFDNLRALPEEELTKQGYTLEYCDKTDEGAFLVQEGKEGFTTRDYTAEELDFAKHRMEQVLDPNDTHTGGTRYSEYLGHDWTDKSYDENTSAYNDAVASLDKLAETHHEMNSYVNGAFVSNSDMLLYKLYQANILAPNADALADNGQPIGEVLSYTDENGHTTTYQDTYHKLLDGEPLTEADAKVLQIVEDHVGGQHEGDVNDMGKIKDFDNLGDGKNPDSYNKDADVGYEPHDHPGQEELYQRITQHTEEGANILPFTMVHDNQGENRALAERVGANAKQVKKEIEDALKRLDDKGGNSGKGRNDDGGKDGSSGNSGPSKKLETVPWRNPQGKEY